MQYFCILTAGRSGSTSLINTLSAYGDIITPDKQTESPDNELLHPKWMARYVAHYQNVTKRSIKNELELIQAFYASSGSTGFAGFKSMPNRHKHLASLTNHPKIKIITLFRRDIASTIASFLLAADKGTWRRNGETQQFRLSYDKKLDERILGHLNYIVQCRKLMHDLKGAIHIDYEDLCQPNFSNDELNSYFNRKITLQNPQQPTDGSSYTDNWQSFKEFVDSRVATTLC